MQNEQRLDNAENKVTSETNGNADIREQTENNLPTTDNSILVNGSSKQDADNVNHEESSETPADTSKSAVEESQPTGEEDRAKDEGNEDKNNETKENNDESEKTVNHEDNENTENPMTQEAEQNTEAPETTVTDGTEQETSTNTIPPPKPPRLKSENCEDVNKAETTLKEKLGTEEKEKDEEESKTNEECSAKSSDEKPKSAISKSADEHTVDTIENSMDKMEGEEHEKSEKTEIDVAQDDADVIQSPAPRTGL